jgi:hypothetical protein
VQKVVDYRRHSEECRKLAERARSPAERQMLLAMADSWDSLADRREWALARAGGPGTASDNSCGSPQG